MMAYDAADGYYLLFGGRDNVTGAPLADTWTFRDGSWTEIVPSVSPPARWGGMMAYDPLDGYVVLYGGVGVSGSDLSDSWTFDGGTWTKLNTSSSPGPVAEGAMAWDPALQGMILYGGTDGGATLSSMWTFTAGGWAETRGSGFPGSLSEAAMAYDAADNEMVLFGGTTGRQVSNMTWTYTASGWSPLPRGAAPSPRTFSAMTTEGLSGAVELFGGESSDGAALGDSWQFLGGTWTNETAQLAGAAPPARWGAALSSNDAAPGAPLLFGGCDSASARGDLWTLAAPLVTSLTSSASVTDVNESVAFTSWVAGGSGPFLYSWNFGDGLLSTHPDPIHLYTSPGSYEVLLSVQDNVGLVANSTLTLNVSTALSGWVSTQPRLLEANQSGSFGADTLGGTPPYNITWDFPGGDLAHGLRARHAFTTPGNATVLLWVNDSVGASVARMAMIHVLPSVRATIDIAPVSGENATEVHLFTTIAGGSGPFNVTWSFGDGSLATGESINHTYAASGTYHVTVWVNDSLNGSWSGTAVVLASEGTAAGPPSGNATVPVVAGASKPAWSDVELALFVAIILGLALGLCSTRVRSVLAYVTTPARNLPSLLSLPSREESKPHRLFSFTRSESPHHRPAKGAHSKVHLPIVHHGPDPTSSERLLVPEEELDPIPLLATLPIPPQDRRRHRTGALETGDEEHDPPEY